MSEEEPRKLPLDELPISWVEPNVCQDNFENRRNLRENGFRWKIVAGDPESHQMTGLIEVYSPDTVNKKQYDQFRDLLVDSHDPWSDYVLPTDIPMDAEGVPYWIHKRAATWNEWHEKFLKGEAKESKEPYLPTRCTRIKKDGNRCWAWAADKAAPGQCRAHAPGAYIEADMGHNIMLAKMRIIQAMPAMVDGLEEMALNAVSEQVRLKAITEMMDRGGVNSSTDVNVATSIDVGQLDPAALIRSRLTDLGERLQAGEAAKKAIEAAFEETAVDVEVIEQPTEESA